MPRTCLACESPHRREIDKRLRSKSPYVDIARWLEAVGAPIHRTSIARHAQHTIGTVDRPRGPRKVSPDFLQAVVDIAHEDLEAGVLRPTIRDGIGAKAELNRQLERGADRDLMLRVALALTGGSNLPRIVSPETEALEAEFRPLLTAGDEADVLVPMPRQRCYPRRHTPTT